MVVALPLGSSALSCLIRGVSRLDSIGLLSKLPSVTPLQALASLWRSLHEWPSLGASASPISSAPSAHRLFCGWLPPPCAAFGLVSATAEVNLFLPFTLSHSAVSRQVKP